MTSVRSWSPKGRFIGKSGRRQWLHCLFGNAFLTSSIFHLHDARAWQCPSVLCRSACLCTPNTTPLSWPVQASQWMLNVVGLKGCNIASKCMGYQRYPVLKYLGGQYFLGFHMGQERTLLQQLGIFRCTPLSHNFFAAIFPALQTLVGR